MTDSTSIPKIHWHERGKGKKKRKQLSPELSEILASNSSWAICSQVPEGKHLCSTRDQGPQIDFMKPRSWFCALCILLVISKSRVELSSLRIHLQEHWLVKPSSWMGMKHLPKHSPPTVMFPCPHFGPGPSVTICGFLRENDKSRNTWRCMRIVAQTCCLLAFWHFSDIKFLYNRLGTHSVSNFRSSRFKKCVNICGKGIPDNDHRNSSFQKLYDGCHWVP